MSDQSNDRFERSIGGLWLKQSKAGNTFMTGEVEIDGVTHPIVVFKNNKGENPRRPDYRIFPSRPKDETSKPRQFDDVPF